jgi:hypothetical protein
LKGKFYVKLSPERGHFESDSYGVDIKTVEGNFQRILVQLSMENFRILQIAIGKMWICINKCEQVYFSVGAGNKSTVK